MLDLAIWRTAKLHLPPPAVMLHQRIAFVPSVKSNALGWDRVSVAIRGELHRRELCRWENAERPGIRCVQPLSQYRRAPPIPHGSTRVRSPPQSSVVRYSDDSSADISHPNICDPTRMTSARQAAARRAR